MKACPNPRLGSGLTAILLNGHPDSDPVLFGLVSRGTAQGAIEASGSLVPGQACAVSTGAVVKNLQLFKEHFNKLPRMKVASPTCPSACSS